jgi:aldehyde:ferredoxin oxidoreductase
MRKGTLAGQHLDRQEFENALSLYYQMAGWDENGVPTPAKKVELELDWTDVTV